MPEIRQDDDPLPALLEEGVEHDVFTCAVATVGDSGGVHRALSVGESDPKTGRRATENSVFDAASLTKPVVTTTIALGLVERGELLLRDELARYVPELEGTERGTVTIRQLLTHTSGLVDYHYDHAWKNHADALSAILESDLMATAPGEAYEYSCLNFVHLATVLERVTDCSFHTLARELVFEPAGMDGARIGALEDQSMDIVVTFDHEYRDHVLRGAIHDPIANVMDGRSGNAGLFATVHDVSAFGSAILDDGMGASGRVLSPASVRLLHQNRTTEHETPRTLGWGLAQDDWPASNWSDRSIGHTGYTGTSLWLDPDADRFAVLLTNEVYTGKDGAIERFRERFHSIIGADRY